MDSNWQFKIRDSSEGLENREEGSCFVLAVWPAQAIGLLGSIGRS